MTGPNSGSKDKYNHLAANCLIFHNVYSMTGVLHRLLGEAVAVEEVALRHLSPYLTEHINRFGVYEWNPHRIASPINYDWMRPNKTDSLHWI